MSIEWFEEKASAMLDEAAKQAQGRRVGLVMTRQPLTFEIGPEGADAGSEFSATLSFDARVRGQSFRRLLAVMAAKDAPSGVYDMEAGCLGAAGAVEWSNGGMQVLLSASPTRVWVCSCPELVGELVAATFEPFVTSAVAVPVSSDAPLSAPVQPVQPVLTAPPVAASIALPAAVSVDASKSGGAPRLLEGTEEQRQQAQALLDGGLSQERAAQRLGVSRATLRRLLALPGVDSRTRPPT